MNILAIADRPPQKNIKALVAEHAIDLICTLGDLDQSQIRELEHITHIPKLGVYGNHCSGVYFEALGIRNMHLATYEYGGLIFGGFEGCVRYKKDAYVKMYTQEEAEALLKDFPRVDVMLTHAPPLGINDEEEVSHQGFRALRTYIDEHHPQYLLHGHTYPPDPEIVMEYKGTKIIYVSGDKIVRVEKTNKCMIVN